MVSMVTTDAKLSSEATEKVRERLARARDNKEFLMNLSASDA